MLCLMLALSMTLCLAGCGRDREEERQPAPALSMPEVNWTAPDGDGVIGQTRTATLYLRGRNDLQRVPRELTLAPADIH